MRFKMKPEEEFDPYKWKVKFAFLPWRINNELIWLEKYEWRYKPTTYYTNWAGSGGELEFRTWSPLAHH